MPKQKKSDEIPQDKNVDESVDKYKTNADKQLYWVFGIMALLIVTFLIGVSFKENPNSVEYEGMTFKKEMFGQIPLYKYTYLTENSVRTSGNVIRTQDTKSVIVYLRNDPRSVEVPVTGKIEYLPKEAFIYLALSPKILCEDSSIAVAGLSSFLSQNDFVIRSGSSDLEDAKTNNLDHITCETHPERMTISLEAGDQSSIVREGNCYRITVANCEILPPIEKFIVQSIIDARENTEK